MKKKVLITGAAGFLSKHVAELLSRRDFELVGLIRTARPVEHFSRLYASVDELVKNEKSFDYIFHLASFIPAAYNSPNKQFVESNIDLTSVLFASYTTARIIYSSSVSVYGTSLSLPITTESPISNPSLYGLSKLAGEAIVRNHPSFGIIRFSSIIGRGMKAGLFFARVIEGAKNGTIVVFGDGSRKQNYIDVRDAAKVCLRIAEAGENIILLGVSEQSVTNYEVAQLAAALTGAKITCTSADDSPSFIYRDETQYDRLGLRPFYSLEQSIQEMIR